MSETDLVKYRNAILWAFDRLTTDGLTQKEIKRTADELGNVILGRPSPAATYIANEWDDSASSQSNQPLENKGDSA